MGVSELPRLGLISSVFHWNEQVTPFPPALSHVMKQMATANILNLFPGPELVVFSVG